MSSTPRDIGTLIAVILKARNLPNKRHIGKQDPYCTIILNEEKRRTKAIKRGGQHPEWDEEIRFTLQEDLEPERTLSGDGTPPPPPPKKSDKKRPKIKGGNFMRVSCWAEDIREPDFIGEAQVDLTEVLTKGETDEWFTLMNKDKYCGEVYLELTFWSNELPPAKKSSSKGDTSQRYGGPGTFTPTTNRHTPSPSRNGLDVYGQRPRLPSMSRTSEDSIPAALRASNSSAMKYDLYTAPYETSRSHQQVSSIDSLTNEFAEFGVQRNTHRRTSFPPAPSGFSQSPSHFSDQQSLSTQSSYSHDSGSFTNIGGSGGYDRPITPTVPTYPRDSFSIATTGQYRPPYETAAQPYVTPSRLPRYSVPPSSSGFVPIPTSTPAPSGFLPSQPTGFVPPPAVTPAPLGYGPPPHTSTPLGYGPPPNMTPPAPTPAPASYGFPPPQATGVGWSLPAVQPREHSGREIIRPSTSYSQLPQSSYVYHQPYGSVPALPATVSQPYAPPPSAPPPNPIPQQPLQQSYVPPHPSIPPPLAAPPDQGLSSVQFPTSASQMYVPPPPPLHDNPSPVYGQGSRPLPQPTQPPNPRPRRQSTLPTPPLPSAGFNTPSASNQSISTIPSNSSFHGIPPPPPLANQQPQQHFNPSPQQHFTPSPQQQFSSSPQQQFNPSPPQQFTPSPQQQFTPSPQQQFSPSPQNPTHSTYVPPPPPLPGNRAISSTSSTNPQPPAPNAPYMFVPPPPPLNNHHARRASLPAPPMGYSQPQSAFQALPPPPAPPALPQPTGSQLVKFPSTSVGQIMYPGPLPRPPSQFLPPSQTYPAPVAGGGWQ